MVKHSDSLPKNQQNQLSLKEDGIYYSENERYNEYRVLNEEIYEKNIDDDDNDNDNENDGINDNIKDSKMSKLVAELAHSVYSDMENIIRIYGNDVGMAVTPIVVKLLEKLDTECKISVEIKRKNNIYQSEIKQLRKYIEREKSFRLEAETSLFQLEEENTEHISHLTQIKSYVQTLEKKLKESQNELERQKLVHSINYSHKNMDDSHLLDDTFYYNISPSVQRNSSLKSIPVAMDYCSYDSIKNTVICENKELKENYEATYGVTANIIDIPQDNENSVLKDSPTYKDTAISTEVDYCEDKSINEKKSTTTSMEISIPIDQNSYPTSDLQNDNLSHYLSAIQSQNEDFYKKYIQCMKENDLYSERLKQINNDIIRIKNLYSTTIHSNITYTSYIKSLQQQLNRSQNQIDELVQESLKYETKLQKLYCQVDFWKSNSKKYKDQLIDIFDLIEWNEKLNSCKYTQNNDNQSNKQKPKSIIKILSKMFSFGTKNLNSSKQKIREKSINYQSAYNSLNEEYLDSIPKNTTGSDSAFVTINENIPFINSNKSEHSHSIENHPLNTHHVHPLNKSNIDLIGNPLITKQLCLDYKDHIWCAVIVNIENKVLPSSTNNNNYPVISLWMAITKNRYSTIKIVDCSDFNNTIFEFDIKKSEVVCMSTVGCYNAEHNYSSSLSQSVDGSIGWTCDNSTISTTTTTTESKNISLHIKEKPLLPIVKNNVEDIDLPTVWIGTDSGLLYVYCAICTSDKPICLLNLESSVICIMHHKGRVLVSLVCGSFYIFERYSTSFHWNFSLCRAMKFNLNYLYIRCCSVLVNSNALWCGCKNNIIIFDMESSQIIKHIVAHNNESYHVRNIVLSGENNLAVVLFRNSSHVYVFDVLSYTRIVSINFQTWFNQNFNMFNLSIRLTSILINRSSIYIGTNRGHLIKMPISEFHRSSSTICYKNTNNNLKLYEYCHSGSVKFLISCPLKMIKTNILLVGGDGLGKIFIEEDDGHSCFYLQEKSLLSYLLVWEDN